MPKPQPLVTIAGSGAGQTAALDRTASHSPRVAVDAVLFTIADSRLQTLLVNIKTGPFAGRWAFPGGLVELGESLDEAAHRELYEKTGVRDLYLEQLFTFGDAGRDPTWHTVAVAYFALVPYVDRGLKRGDKYADIDWFPVHALPHLPYDHGAIAAYALKRLQAKLGYTNIVYSLLPNEFILREIPDYLRSDPEPPPGPAQFPAQDSGLGVAQTPAKNPPRCPSAGLYAFTQRRPMNVGVL